MDNDASTTPNIFLQGNFGPVREEITADNLTVIGKLPPEMDGMFVRNGPNPQFPPMRPSAKSSRPRCIERAP
jgi:carotenoid cleavage dioxygenase